jgi:hypothetical protein
MRYKTKKYIKKSVLYVFNAAVITLLYVIAAHKLYLPALFEFYTGDVVRKNTLVYYEKYSGLFGAQSSGAETAAFDYMNLVDYLAREPDYLYINDILNTIESGSNAIRSAISKEIKDDVISISTHPALVEWLKNPESPYASVYQYEAIRFIDGVASVHDYVIFAKDNKVLFSRGKLAVKDDSSQADKSADLEYNKGLAWVSVKHKGMRVGKFLADTGGLIPVDLNFENSGMDVSYFLLSDSGKGLEQNGSQGGLQNGGTSRDKVVKKNISNTSFQKFVRDDVYHGPYAGIHDDYRFILKNFGRQSLLIIYKAESTFFYISKFILYIILVSFVIGLYILTKKGILSTLLNDLFKKKQHSDIDDLLKKSNEMTGEYAAMSVKFQSSLQQVKNQEIDRLRVISEHLGFLRQSVYQSMDQDVHELKSPD